LCAETQTTELDDLYTVDDYENEQNDTTEIDCDVTSSSSQQQQQLHRRNRDVTTKQHTGGESKTTDHGAHSGSKTCVEQLTRCAKLLYFSPLILLNLFQHPHTAPTMSCTA
jgi:hypothetical protein